MIRFLVLFKCKPFVMQVSLPKLNNQFAVTVTNALAFIVGAFQMVVFDALAVHSIQ